MIWSGVLWSLEIFTTVYMIIRITCILGELVTMLYVQYMVTSGVKRIKTAKQLNRLTWRLQSMAGVVVATRKTSEELSGIFLLTAPYQVWHQVGFYSSPGGKMLGSVGVLWWLWDAWRLWKGGGSDRWKKRGKRALSRVRAVGARLVVVPVPAT